jgi:hypothetical protein
MKPSPHVRSNITDDGVILLDIETGQIFSANPIGARIWDALTHGLAVPAIVDQIARDTGAERAVVERDVREFVGALRARALVTEV